MGVTGVTGVILREYRADRRARLKVLALIALMLACGVLEVVIIEWCDFFLYYSVAPAGTDSATTSSGIDST